MREALSFLDKAAPSTDFLKHHMREAFESTTQYRHSAWVLMSEYNPDRNWALAPAQKEAGR